jgi:hypothetical protein
LEDEHYTADICKNTLLILFASIFSLKDNEKIMSGERHYNGREAVITLIRLTLSHNCAVQEGRKSSGIRG